MKLDWKYVLDQKLREKSDSQDIILKFNQIVVLNSLPESNPKPEGQNPKPETIVYEKPDSTRYPNVQTRPDPKPDTKPAGTRLWKKDTISTTISQKKT